VKPSGELRAKHRVLGKESRSNLGAGWSSTDLEQLAKYAELIKPGIAERAKTGQQNKKEDKRDLFDWLACELGRFKRRPATNLCQQKVWTQAKGAGEKKGVKQNSSGVSPGWVARTLEKLGPATAKEVCEAVAASHPESHFLCRKVAPGTRALEVWKKQVSCLLAAHGFFRKDSEARPYRYALSEEGLAYLNGEGFGTATNRKRKNTRGDAKLMNKVKAFSLDMRST
jgi:hypothetical protein